MPDTSLHEQLNRLLAALDCPLSPTEEEADPAVTTVGGQAQPTQEEQPARPPRIVNIYLDLSGDDEMRTEAAASQTVESTLNLDGETDLPLSHEAPCSFLTGEPRFPRQQRRSLMGRQRLMLVTLLVLVGLGLAAWSLGTLLFPAASATITIVPVSTPITTTSTLHVVTQGVVAGAPNHISGRLLTRVSMSQRESIPTTGISTQQASVARGSITFYNAAPTPQTVLAGTLISSPTGGAVVTDRTVSIAAAHYPLFGQATVAAHAVQAGPGGNLPAGAIYGPCCRLNLSAVSSAFQGGQVARSYHSVSQQDAATLLTRLTTRLQSSLEAVLQAHVSVGETLLHPLDCQTHHAADQPIGAEAAQLSMSVSETCTAVVWQKAAFEQEVTRLLQDQVTRQLGEDYQCVGEIATTTTTITPKAGGVLDVGVKMSGTGAYQFGPPERIQLLRALAGKRKAEALTVLLHMPGVQRASLSIERGSTVPTDPAQIHLIVLSLI